jgi:hypothetical protein
VKEIKTSLHVMQRWRNVLSFKGLKIGNGGGEAREEGRTERKVEQRGRLATY